LVEEDERKCTVTVFVVGDRKTEYISLLRDTMNSIFDDYKTSRPELKYEVLVPAEMEYSLGRSVNLTEVNKLLHTEENIAGNASAGQKLVIGNSLVDPEPTIKQYNITVNIDRNYGPIPIDGKGHWA